MKTLQRRLQRHATPKTKEKEAFAFTMGYEPKEEKAGSVQYDMKKKAPKHL